MARSSAEVSCIPDSAMFTELPSMMSILLGQTLFYLFSVYPHSLKTQSEILHMMYSRHWKKTHKAALKDSEAEDQYYL